VAELEDARHSKCRSHKEVSSIPTVRTKLTSHKGKYFRSWSWADVLACGADTNDPKET
jgi:hypothetical protein